jgi:hypothetical protein
MPSRIDITGQQFGYLRVIEYYGNKKWLCECVCGEKKPVARRWLVGGNTKSCGCKRGDMISAAHSKGRTREDKLLQNVYHSMLQRCYNQQRPEYRNYGGRGIFVCPEWSIGNFEAFREWAILSGYKQGLDLDRIDNSKGYSPDNCRWATRTEQIRNRRVTVRVEIYGELLTLAEIAEKYGTNYNTIKTRYRRGLKGEELLDVKK